MKRVFLKTIPWVFIFGLLGVTTLFAHPGRFHRRVVTYSPMPDCQGDSFFRLRNLSQKSCFSKNQTWQYNGASSKYYVWKATHFGNNDCCLCFEDKNWVRIIPSGKQAKYYTKYYNSEDSCFSKNGVWVKIDYNTQIKPHLTTYYEDSGKCKLWFYYGGKRTQELSSYDGRWYYK